jgi:hypothetical protein
VCACVSLLTFAEQCHIVWVYHRGVFFISAVLVIEPGHHGLEFTDRSPSEDVWVLSSLWPSPVRLLGMDVQVQG